VSEVFFQGVHVSAGEQQLIVEQCQTLYQHLVAPAYAVRVSHYLRSQWAGVLKPTGLWLLIYLRSTCYWNPETEELRDQGTIPDLKGLAKSWGRNVRTLERTLQRLQEQGFVPRWQRQRVGAGRQKRREVRFQVQMWDPIAFSDRARYEELLRREAEGVGMTVHPARADGSTPGGLNGEEEQTATKLNGEVGQSVTKLNYERGQSRTKLNYDAERTVTKLNYGVTKLNCGTGQSRTKLNGIQDSIEDSSQDLESEDQQKKTPEKAEGSLAVAAVALPELLDALHIVGKARQELLAADVSPENALAWSLYGLREPGLADRLAGWLINRLRDPHDRDHPPQPFAQFARLPRSQWTSLAVAAHQRRITGRWWVSDLPGEVAEAWWEIYGGEEAVRLPFGLGEKAARQIDQEAESWERALSPPAPAGWPVGGPPEPAQERWAEILAMLKILTTPQVFRSLLASARAVSLEKGNGAPQRLVVEVGSYEAQERLNRQLGRVVQRAVRAVGAAPLAVTFVARNGHAQALEREAVDD